MRYDRETWRRLYRSEPLEQRAWNVMTRGIRDLLIRFPEDDDGVLLPRTADPVGDLARALNPGGHEGDSVRDSIETLLEDGYLEYVPRPQKGGDTEGTTTGTLRIRNFGTAQAARSKEAEKKAKQRARARGQLGDSDQDNQGDSVGGHVGDSPVEEKRREEKRSQTERAADSPGTATGTRREPSRPSLRRPQRRDPMAHLDAHGDPECVWAFDEWVAAFDLAADTSPTPPRMSALKARLDETRSAGRDWRADVRAVFTAGKADPFVSERCGGELLRMFESREQFERFRRGPQKTKAGKPVADEEAPVVLA